MHATVTELHCLLVVFAGNCKPNAGRWRSSNDCRSRLLGAKVRPEPSAVSARDLCSAQCTNRVLARIRLSGIRSRFIYSLLHTDRIWSWRNCSAVIIASQRFAKFILGREQFRPRPQAREAPRVLTEWSLREEARTKSAANDLAYSFNGQLIFSAAKPTN